MPQAKANNISIEYETVGNPSSRKRTNPYLIREFMLSADLREHTLDPGYRFVF